MNPKPFLDAIPSITSPYSLIAFALVVVACFLAYSLKAEGPVFRIVEKKLTKIQAFSLFKLIAILCFSFAALIFILGYTLELIKAANEKSEQTSIILFDNKYDISDPFQNPFKPSSAYFISVNPNFAFPQLNRTNWESPKWINSKEELAKYFSIIMPKDFKLEDPFFDFLENSKALFLFAKDPVSLTLDKKTNIVNDDPFAEEIPEGVFEDPFSLKGRSGIAISAIPKRGLRGKFKIVSTSDMLHYFLSILPFRVDQVLSTRNSAAFTSQVKFNNVIFQDKRQNLTIFRCYRFIEGKEYFYFLDGACYAPEISPQIASDITNCIFRFQIPKS